MQCDQIMLYERLDFIIFQMYDLCVQFCSNINSIMLFSFILLLLPPQKGNEGTQSEAPDRANDITKVSCTQAPRGKRAEGILGKSCLL